MKYGYGELHTNLEKNEEDLALSWRRRAERNKLRGNRKKQE